MDPFLTCIPKLLAIEIAEQAADYAMSQNADNAPHPSHVTAAIQAASAVGRNLEKPAIAALVKKMWPKDKGIELMVGFMDTPPAALITKIMSHMNAWGTRSNVHFSMTQNWQDARVRIARTDGADGGYWSYIGTDIDLADKGAPTMNLQGFTLAGTPDSEFYRVVRHDSGHTLGFVHEHMRSGMVSRIDKQKAYVYYGYTQQWSQAMVDDQILTPIPDADLVGTADDAVSIMCYQVPGEVTINGKPILGGLDIDATDYAFAAMCYPLPAVSAGSPPPMVRTATLHVSVAAHASHASHDTGDGIASTAFDSDGSSALPMLDDPGDSSGADTPETTAGAVAETLASASSPVSLPTSPAVSEVYIPLVEARGQVLAELPNGVRFSLPHSVTEQVIARLFTGVEPTATIGAPLSATIAGAPEHPAHDLLPSSSSSSGALLPRILKGILSDATSPITDAGVIMACAITGHSWARLKAGKNVRYDMESDVGKLALPVDPVKLATAKAAEAASRQSLDSAIAAINRALASCTNNFMGTHGPSMVYTGLAPVHGLNGVTRVIGGTGDNPLLDPARYDPPTPANLPGEMLYQLALSANFTNSKANSNPNSAAPINPGQRTDGQLQGYQGQGAYTGFVQGRDDGQSNLFTTYRHVIPPDQVRWIPRPVPDTFPPVPTVDSNANPGPFPTEGYWGMMGSIKDQADLAAQGMYFQDADPARASGKALTPTTVLGYTHGMIQAIYDVEFQKLTAPGKNAGTPYEIAVGDHTTKLSSCVACAFFMEATGYPASSTHLGRGECWAPLYPESPSGRAIDMTSKQNIARKAANDKWAVYCKTIVDSVLACDGFRGQLKTDAHRASFDQLRNFVRGKDAGTYANLILDALTVRKSETARLLETLE